MKAEVKVAFESETVKIPLAMILPTRALPTAGTGGRSSRRSRRRIPSSASLSPRSFGGSATATTSCSTATTASPS